MIYISTNIFPSHSYIPSPFMSEERKQYGKLFFKLLLLGVYFSFFIVQFSISIIAQPTQQNPVSISFNAPKKIEGKSISTAHSKNLPSKNYGKPYLNKHFEPQSLLFLALQDFQVRPLFKEVSSAYIFFNAPINKHASITSFLRGPPSLG